MAESFEQLSEQVLQLRIRLASAKKDGEGDDAIRDVMTKLGDTIEQQKLVVEVVAVEAKTAPQTSWVAFKADSKRPSPRSLC